MCRNEATVETIIQVAFGKDDENIDRWRPPRAHT
jgi:hypothetical protein